MNEIECNRCGQTWTPKIPGCRWRCWLSRHEGTVLVSAGGLFLLVMWLLRVTEVL